MYMGMSYMDFLNICTLNLCTRLVPTFCLPADATRAPRVLSLHPVAGAGHTPLCWVYFACGSNWRVIFLPLLQAMSFLSSHFLPWSVEEQEWESDVVILSYLDHHNIP